MKKRLTLAIILILAAILLLGTVTFAWFRNYKMNNVYASELVVDAESNFLIATSSDGPYGTSLSFSYTDLILRNITGNGVTFSKPVLANEFDITEHGIAYESLYSAVPDGTEDWTTPVATNSDSTQDANADYISIDVYFKSSVNGDVYLGANSYIDPQGKGDTLVGDAAGIFNKSIFGDFSKNLIAGATRVSFVDMSDESNPSLSLIWIPHSEYELSYRDATANPSDGVTYGWSFDMNGTPEDEIIDVGNGYYYYTAYKTKAYLQRTDYIKTIPSTGSKLLTLTESTEEPGVYIGHLKVNVWIEGCDREARRALAGGVLSMKLDFTIQENVNP